MPHYRLRRMRILSVGFIGFFSPSRGKDLCSITCTSKEAQVCFALLTRSESASVNAHTVRTFYSIVPSRRQTYDNTILILSEVASEQELEQIGHFVEIFIDEPFLRHASRATV